MEQLVTRMNVLHYWPDGSDTPLCGKVLVGRQYESARKPKAKMCPRCARRAAAPDLLAACEALIITLDFCRDGMDRRGVGGYLFGHKTDPNATEMIHIRNLRAAVAAAKEGQHEAAL